MSYLFFGLSDQAKQINSQREQNLIKIRVQNKVDQLLQEFQQSLNVSSKPDNITEIVKLRQKYDKVVFINKKKQDKFDQIKQQYSHMSLNNNKSLMKTQTCSLKELQNTFHCDIKKNIGDELVIRLQQEVDQIYSKLNEEDLMFDQLRQMKHKLIYQTSQLKFQIQNINEETEGFSRIKTNLNTRIKEIENNLIQAKFQVGTKLQKNKKLIDKRKNRIQDTKAKIKKRKEFIQQKIQQFAQSMVYEEDNDIQWQKQSEWVQRVIKQQSQDKSNLANVEKKLEHYNFWFDWVLNMSLKSEYFNAIQSKDKSLTLIDYYKSLQLHQDQLNSNHIQNTQKAQSLREEIKQLKHELSQLSQMQTIEPEEIQNVIEKAKKLDYDNAQTYNQLNSELSYKRQSTKRQQFVQNEKILFTILQYFAILNTKVHYLLEKISSISQQTEMLKVLHELENTIKSQKIGLFTKSRAFSNIKINRQSRRNTSPNIFNFNIEQIIKQNEDQSTTSFRPYSKQEIQNIFIQFFPGSYKYAARFAQTLKSIPFILNFITEQNIVTYLLQVQKGFFAGSAQKNAIDQIELIIEIAHKNVVDQFLKILQITSNLLTNSIQQVKEIDFQIENQPLSKQQQFQYQNFRNTLQKMIQGQQVFQSSFEDLFKAAFKPRLSAILRSSSTKQFLRPSQFSLQQPTKNYGNIYNKLYNQNGSKLSQSSSASTNQVAKAVKKSKAQQNLDRLALPTIRSQIRQRYSTQKYKINTPILFSNRIKRYSSVAKLRERL